MEIQCESEHQIIRIDLWHLLGMGLFLLTCWVIAFDQATGEATLSASCIVVIQFLQSG
jgi:hypothetical protein